MKVTEFSNETKVDHVTPPWNKFLSENDFISYMPSYSGNKYLDLFDDFIYPCAELGGIRYYLFSPTKHGMSENKNYPLIVFIHGATNSLDGKICVSHSGAEMFASSEYQSQMDGAFILVPLANEKKDENGNLKDSWNEKYLPHLKTIIQKIKNENSSINKVIIGGGSSGGYMTWEMLKSYPDLIDAAFPVSGFTNDMQKCLGLGKKIFVACAKHDEFGSFDELTKDDLVAFENDPDVICYFPELLRNGDGGVASLYFGIEMGQHCMITQIQANLIYDDGKPYLEKLPNGMTGWIKELRA